MKVFLSSTAQDLEAYRRVADDTILRLSQQSVAMERFGPLPDAPVEECERLARECDVVVCIVAHRYGYVPEKGRGSITRREVEAAHKAGKDVLVWIVSDDHPWTDKKEQDLLADPSVVADPAKVADVAEGVAGLLDFKAWLRKAFTPETFTTPDDLGRKIAVALANYVKGHTAPSVSQDKISIARLPASGAELFGRETELKLLDDTWANPTINILSFVAWGGVGKTALINHWLKRRMARDNYRGAERVYGWSFYSQGTSERAASADLFIDQALRWFGDPDPTSGGPWDKGERLARYVRQSRTLLILDGLEPLQYPPGAQEGRIKDTGMQAFLIELAAQNLGLCVVSTREHLGDLVEFENGTVLQHMLDQLSPQAGAQILRSLNVKGDDDELEKASTELKGHAFSLTLLGSYLDEVLNSDIRRRKEIGNLFEDSRLGKAAERMISVYQDWLGDGIELAILRLLGLFDRPADSASIQALRRAPAIAGLTEPFQAMSVRDWNRAVAKLRRIKLVGEASGEPGTVDAHPLVREYFKQHLKQVRPDAWREANHRLFDHLQNVAAELPNTVEEMSPLYNAVTHGCAAGRYDDALSIYIRRIQRGNDYFNWWSLGAFSADLSMLSNFFEEEWHQSRTALSVAARALILNNAGYDLMALGRLKDAVEPMEQALGLAGEDFGDSAMTATNLAELHTRIGNLERALGLAEKAVELADSSEDEIMQFASFAVVGRELHLLGRFEEAASYFAEAEARQHQMAPDSAVLYGIPGTYYCEFLLDVGKYDEVERRSTVLLEFAKEHNLLILIGINNVLLGLVYLRGNLKNTQAVEASDLLSDGVKWLRQSRLITQIPDGLLARAELNRVRGDYKLAEQDLSEVLRIASGSAMELYLADYNLEYARLLLAQDHRGKAREHLATAKEMIDRMSYHRRDKEVAELEAQLA